MAQGAHAASFQVGAYLSNPNASDASDQAVFEANYASFTAAMGQAPLLIDAYIDYSQPVSSWASNASWQAWSNRNSPNAGGMIPVIGFPLASTAGGAASPDAQFQAFASGQYDSAIEGVVQAWTSQGFKALIMRVAWEMNIEGPTYAGADAQTQADWVAAFRHVYTVLHKAAAAQGAQMEVVWNPNATNYETVNTRTALYPGNAFVDVIGVDIYGGMYPFTDGNGEYHDWVTGGEDATLAAFIAKPANRWHYWSFPAATEWSLDGSDGHSLTFKSLINFAKAHGKPFAVPETGAGNSQPGNDVNDDPTFPQWLGSVLKNAMNNGVTVAFVNIWDTNDNGNYNFSDPASDKPQERAAWKSSIAAIDANVQ